MFKALRDVFVNNVVQVKGTVFELSDTELAEKLVAKGSIEVTDEVVAEEEVQTSAEPTPETEPEAEAVPPVAEQPAAAQVADPATPTPEQLQEDFASTETPGDTPNTTVQLS